MTPSVGDVVWYWCTDTSRLAAMVTAVHSSDCVSLCVYAVSGEYTFGRPKVTRATERERCTHWTPKGSPS